MSLVLAMHACQHLGYFGFVLNLSRFSTYLVISYCGFNLHFPNDQWCWAWSFFFIFKVGSCFPISVSGQQRFPHQQQHSTWKLLRHQDLLKPKLWEWGLSFISPSKWFSCAPESENHWLTAVSFTHHWVSVSDMNLKNKISVWSLSPEIQVSLGLVGLWAFFFLKFSR